MYRKTVLDHFRNFRHGGVIESETGTTFCEACQSNLEKEHEFEQSAMTFRTVRQDDWILTYSFRINVSNFSQSVCHSSKSLLFNPAL